MRTEIRTRRYATINKSKGTMSVQVVYWLYKHGSLNAVDDEIYVIFDCETNANFNKQILV